MYRCVKMSVDIEAPMEKIVASNPRWVEAVSSNPRVQKYLEKVDIVRALGLGITLQTDRSKERTGAAVALRDRARETGVLDTDDPLFLSAARTAAKVYYLKHPLEKLRELFRER